MTLGQIESYSLNHAALLRLLPLLIFCTIGSIAHTQDPEIEEEAITTHSAIEMEEHGLNMGQVVFGHTHISEGKTGSFGHAIIYADMVIEVTVSSMSSLTICWSFILLLHDF